MIDLGRCFKDGKIEDQTVSFLQQLNPSKIIRVGGGVDEFCRQLSRHFAAERLINFAEDPPVQWVDQAARHCGLMVPPMTFDRPAGGGGGHQGSGWLVKPQRGSGGIGISRYADRSHAPVENPVYYQREVTGVCIGVTYVVDRGRSMLADPVKLADAVKLVGAVENFTQDIAGQPFVYAGSVGPVEMVRHRAAMERLGEFVAGRCPGVGCFNIDFIIDGSQCWVLEINARYSASMEIHERILGRSLLLHAGDGVGTGVKERQDESRHAGDTRIRKEVVFARSECRFQIEGIRRTFPGRQIADFPNDGTVIGEGEPICTLLDRIDGRAAI